MVDEMIKRSSIDARLSSKRPSSVNYRRRHYNSIRTHFRPTHDLGPKLKGMKLAFMAVLSRSNHLQTVRKVSQGQSNDRIIRSTYRSGR